MIALYNICKIKIILLFCCSGMLIQPAESCWGSSSLDEYVAKPPPVKKVTIPQELSDRINLSAMNGFNIPPHLLTEWEKWFVKNRHDTVDSSEIDRGPDSGWPIHWQGLDAGMSKKYPPWGKIPMNTGLPQLCYLPLAKGNCTQSIQRWAYNVFIDECVQFQYTGCYENRNNFKTVEKCMEACVGVSDPAGCDYKSSIPMDDPLYDITRRKLPGKRRCGFK